MKVRSLTTARHCDGQTPSASRSLTSFSVFFLWFCGILVELTKAMIGLVRRPFNTEIQSLGIDGEDQNQAGTVDDIWTSDHVHDTVGFMMFWVHSRGASAADCAEQD